MNFHEILRETFNNVNESNKISDDIKNQRPALYFSSIKTEEEEEIK